MKRKPDPVLERIEPELERTLQDFGYELVQARLGGRVGNRTLTLLIDKPGGVTVADCQYMSERLSVLLDTIDPIEGRYTLMVSSPGVDRPLTRATDFERFAGERVSIRWSDAGKRPRTQQGVLLGIRDDVVRIQVNDEEVPVPLADIEAASILYDWDKDVGPED